MLKYILLWFPMLVLAVANGAARDVGYSRRLGDLRAHQLSTVTLIVLFGLYTWGVFRLWPPASTRQAAAVGAVWVALTLAFEFLFGHYVAGHPWNRLLQDYNLFAGRVWVFVPVWVAVAPVLIYRLGRH